MRTALDAIVPALSFVGRGGGMSCVTRESVNVGSGADAGVIGDDMAIPQ